MTPAFRFPSRLALAALLLLAGSSQAQQPRGARPPTTYVQVQQLLSSGQAAQALAELERRMADSARGNTQGNTQDTTRDSARDPQLRFLRAVALAELGRQDEAIAALVELTETYPELPEPYNNLAVLYAARDELDKARDALEMAVRARPDYAVAQENLGDIYLRLAQRAYQRGAALTPGVARSTAPKLTALRQVLAPPAPR